MVKLIAVILALIGLGLIVFAPTFGLNVWYGIILMVVCLLALIGIRFFNASSGENLSIKG